MASAAKVDRTPGRSVRPYTVRGAAATTAALHGRGRKAGKHIMAFTISSLVWLILLIAFVVVEALTVSLVSIWFAAGAVAALIVSGFTS